MIGKIFGFKKDDNLPLSTDGRPMRYADFNSRTMAGMIDFVLLMVIFTPIANLFSAQIPTDYTQENIEALSPEETLNLLYNSFSFEGFLAMFLQMIFLIIIFFYFWHKYQASPGGMLLSMRIVDEKTFERPTLKQNLIRALGSILSSLPPFLGFFWIIFSKKKQSWHDKMAGTVVITLGRPKS